MLSQLRRRLLVGVTIGVGVVIALVVISDADALARALRDFDWRLLPLVLGLTLLNYALRFVKWQYYLRLLGVTSLSRVDSLLIYVAGFTMVMTPGKVGELLKSYLLRLRAGTPMARSAPIIVAERLSDGCAMLLLAGVGLTVFRYGWPVLLFGAVFSISALYIVQQEALMHRILRRIAATRLGRGRAAALEELYDSTRTLLRWRPLLVAVGLGVVSWFGECLAFFLVLTGLGMDATWTLLLAAVFVFAISSWLGGASMLPGGLGAAELSVAGLLLIVVDDPAMTATLAGTATLLIRFATLWFGVLLGVLALSRVSSWHGTVSPIDPVDGAQPAAPGRSTQMGDA
jgi:uncharacterized protein (TIRG00374 family)